MDDIPGLVKKVLGAKLWNEGSRAPTLRGDGGDNGSVVQAIRSLAGSTGKEAQTSAQTPDTNETTSSATPSGERVGGEELWGGRPWRSNVMDLEGEILCVSQFTLYARMNKGTKPDFHKAMGGPAAKELYDTFVQKLREGYKADRIAGTFYIALTFERVLEADALLHERGTIWSNDERLLGECWTSNDPTGYAGGQVTCRGNLPPK